MGWCAWKCEPTGLETAFPGGPTTHLALPRAAVVRVLRRLRPQCLQVRPQLRHRRAARGDAAVAAAGNAAPPKGGEFPCGLCEGRALSRGLVCESVGDGLQGLEAAVLRISRRGGRGKGGCVRVRRVAVSGLEYESCVQAGISEPSKVRKLCYG